MTMVVLSSVDFAFAFAKSTAPSIHMDPCYNIHCIHTMHGVCDLVLVLLHVLMLCGWFMTAGAVELVCAGELFVHVRVLDKNGIIETVGTELMLSNILPTEFSLG